MPIVRITRRGALALGGGAAAAGVAGALGLGSARTPQSRLTASSKVLSQHGSLPAVEIERIVEADGLMSDGVLTINVKRDDIGTVEGPLGIVFTGSFGLVGTLCFQPLGDDLAFFSGDLPVRPRETDRFIDAIIANGLTFQGCHQSFREMRPQIFSIHWRGAGNPLRLAHSVRNVLRATKLPLPQTQPEGPQSPLDAEHLAEILHGGAQIGGEGVVTVNVSRRDRAEIAGVHVSSTFATSTSVAFKPRSAKGALTDVAPDFAMRGVEVQRVIDVMREQGWLVSGLASHTTQETPQLYFAQMLKTGDAYAVAGEIRHGLDRTDSAD